MRHVAQLKRDPAERGMLLLPVLVLTLLLGGLSLAMLEEGPRADRASVRHHETSLLALEVAEAGLVRAEMEVYALADPDDDGIGTVTAPYAEGMYDVTAAQDANFPDRWTVRARGERDLSTRTIEVGLRRRAGGYFVEGLFSDKDLLLDGTIATDSYDSRKGKWGDQAIHSDVGGPYAGGRGHVGSNRAIGMNGSSVVVRGNAIPGPLDVVTQSGDPDVWGDMMPRERVIPLPPPPIEDFLEALNNNDNDQLVPSASNAESSADPAGQVPPGQEKKISSAYDPDTMTVSAQADTQVVLEGGTYFFTELTLSALAQLVIRGPSRIYITGDVNLTGGGIVNESGRATDCLIFAHPYPLPLGHSPAGNGLKVNGGAQAAFALYAPALEVTVGGNSDVFGAVVAGDIKVSGDAYFHYDEALRDVDGGTVVTLERLYWRETSVPHR